MVPSFQQYAFGALSFLRANTLLSLLLKICVPFVVCRVHEGAVAAVQQVKNPITLARAVMEQTDHCLLVADGARRFADEIGIPRADPDELVTEAGKAEFELFSAPGYSATVSDLFSSGVSTADTKLGHDTVGCVAFDGTGRIAAATSTGGITMKRPGGVGDSPLIGSGGYADSAVGGCSTTGHGEAIMRTLLASRAVAELGDSAAHGRGEG